MGTSLLCALCKFLLVSVSCSVCYYSFSFLWVIHSSINELALFVLAERAFCDCSFVQAIRIIVRQLSYCIILLWSVVFYSFLLPKLWALNSGVLPRIVIENFSIQEDCALDIWNMLGLREWKTRWIMNTTSSRPTTAAVQNHSSEPCNMFANKMK